MQEAARDEARRGPARSPPEEMPMTQDPRVPSTFLTARFSAAVEYAAVLHATQVRKKSSIPYISHLLAVAGSVLEAGGTENMAIAGLLHDAAEDQGGETRLLDIEARFGPEVARIVRGCSDTLVADRALKEPYEVRKRAYVSHLATADLATVIVATADKLHNARAILTDLEIDNAQPKTDTADPMAKFTGTSAQILWYYRECLAIAIAAGVPPILTTPLAHVVRELHEQLAGPEA